MTEPETNHSPNLSHPSLGRSFKNRYPFFLACPSFIYPDHILPNVRMLADFLDEIEVLIFESAPARHLPPAADIREMAAIGAARALRYNVHLPVDVNIAHPDASHRTDGLERMLSAIDRVRPLCPTTWTLHLPFDEPSTDAASIGPWQDRALASADTLLNRSGLAPRSVSVENLNYPLDWLDPVIQALDLSVCLDTGHLMEHGHDPGRVFGEYKDRISILHIYGGVARGRGHVGLHRLPAEQEKTLTRILDQFTGIVSLEVFSHSDLTGSLAALEQLVSSERFR